MPPRFCGKGSNMNKKAIIKVPLAPYFCAPAWDAEPDDEGWYGQAVELVEDCGDGWYKINAPYRYETYANARDLYIDEEGGELARLETGDLRTVWGPAADVRSEPKYVSALLVTLHRGALVEVVEDPEERYGWAKVRLVGGKEGYIKKTHLGRYNRAPVAGEEMFRSAVAEAAKLYMGTQYRWGGKTPMGIDCSGLVGAAYLLCGVKLYRNARIVEGYPLHKIDAAQMKKGDLLFFKGHVAMYLGDGIYIHSTGRAGDDGVVLNSLSEGHPLYRDDLAHGILAVGSIF